MPTSALSVLMVLYNRPASEELRTVRRTNLCIGRRLRLITGSKTTVPVASSDHGHLRGGYPMTTSTYALRLKLDIVLNDQPQLTYADNSAIWDYEPERRLIWIDQDSLDHICEIPPVTMPLDYRPRTICGRAVSTTRIRLVDTEEYPLPSCPSCYVAYLGRLHGPAVGAMIGRSSK